MKYLYPLECQQEGLSSPADLQAAIDGNRREGRRAGYSAASYPDFTQRTPLITRYVPTGRVRPRTEAGGNRTFPNRDLIFDIMSMAVHGKDYTF